MRSQVKMLMQAAPPGRPPAGIAQYARDVLQEGGAPAFFRGNAVNVSG